jgi:hypothetical protein
MRMTCVLALALFTTTSVWGQATNSAPTVPPTGANNTDPYAPALTTAPDDGLDLTQGRNCGPQLFWLRADYLLWWVRKETMPTLISTVPKSLENAITLPPGAAVPVFPIGDELNYKPFNGVRLNLGAWLDSSHTWGIDMTGFVTDQQTNNATVASQGDTIFARNYTAGGTQQVLELSSPVVGAKIAGIISATAAVSDIYSGDVNIRYAGYRIFADTSDWLFGFRYFNFDERIDVSSVSLIKSIGTLIAITDHFATTNNFYGGQVGLNTRWCDFYGFSFDSTVKLAMGGMVQTVNVSGANVIAAPGVAPSVQATGLFAQQSNSGTFSHDVFSVIPDVTLNLGYNFTQHAAIFLGYNFTYVSNTLRAGSTIDPNVPTSSLRYVSMSGAMTPTTSTAGPAPTFREQGVWLQGLNLGFRFEY